jgi:hypothetical protein
VQRFKLREHALAQARLPRAAMAETGAGGPA